MPTLPSRLPRRWLRAALHGLFLLALGCAPGVPDYQDLNHLNGLLVTDDGVTVVADVAWRGEGEHGGSFRKTAALLVMISGDRPDGLRLTLTPDGATEPLHFQASWDGEPLWDRPRRSLDQPLVAQIASAQLGVGVHRLRIDRVRDLDDPADRDRPQNVFDRIEVERLDGDGWQPTPVTANLYLAYFLDFGVTGQDACKRDGCLFVGPRRHGFVLDRSEPSRVSFVVQNQSREVAGFSVTVDGTVVSEVRVEPRTEAPLSFELAGGRRNVELVVEGFQAGCFLWGSPSVEVNRARKPPVVLITLDTTRRDAVAPYSERAQLVTPVLADLARRATVYTDAYAAAPWTLPSHASIFTGLYPSVHRAGVTEDVLDRSVPTLAEGFREAGYRTAGFIGGSMASSRFGLAQGFSFYCDPKNSEEPGDVISDRAIEFIEDHGDSSLFLFLNFFDPHELYAAPEEFQRLLGVDELAAAVRGMPEWEAFARDSPEAWAAIRDGRVSQTREGLALLEAKYLAEVAFMDHEIGRVFDALRRRGLFDPALIVLVADHGEFLGERGLYSHSYRLDRELTAVPLIIKWPEQHGAQTVDDLVSHVDLPMAIAAAAGLQPPTGDGVRFSQNTVAALRSRPLVYMEEHESRFHPLEGPAWLADHLIGLQRLDAREVVWPGNIECAYRTASGWSEVPCTRSWDEVVAGLPAAMASSLARDVEYSAVDLDEADAERLRALGYLE